MSDDKTRISQRFAGADVGTQLSGIYELDARIATGGMGEVYRGHNIQTGDSVAIKIVLPEFAHDQTILSLFRKEASILNHLSHDAVVRYHVFTIDPGIGRPYLAMEFVDGESLFDVLRHGAMPVDEVCRLCHRLTSGLAAVHDAGAIHRDLSPDNIILPGGRVERAKIVDFGIARSETVGGGTLIDGKFAGKYNYVSPEQLGLFGGQVSPQSDIYSLGLVLAAALRGKPLDMSGSQLDVVEKRRTVPDLSDIDMGFRPLLEAMLQPLPANRPQSMAEIAAMTRDGIVDVRGTRSPIRRDEGQPGDEGWRSGEASLPPTSQPPAFAATNERSRLPASATEPGFVEHVRPNYLSGGRPRAPSAPGSETAPAKTGSGRTTGLVAAAASLVVVVGVAGAYFGGFLGSSGQKMPEGGASAALTPAPASPEQPAPAPQTNEAASAAPAEPATAEGPAGTESQPAPPAPASAGNSAAERLAEALAQKPEGKAKSPAETEQKAAPSSKPTLEPTATNDSSKITAAAGETSSEPAPTAKEPSPAPAAKVVEAKPQPTPPAAEQPQKSDQPKPVEAQPQPATPPQPAETKAAPAAPAQDTEASTEPAQKNVANSATSEQPVTPAPAATGADAGTQPSGSEATPNADGSGQIVAMNIPKPVNPAGDAIDVVAQRISWLRTYEGGNCFYASAIAATDKSIEIEGFGTAVEPFAQLESAFEAKFQLEPEIDVRLIEPGQCQVANFLGSLSASKAEKPQLVLDRTSIPDGAALSGTLRTEPGLKSAMLLIDHKGMMFNLDDRVVVARNQASFNIPIGLGAADKSLGKPVPQIVLVVTGPRPLQAAEISAPVRAEDALPKILSEIREGGGEFSATAKYFRLGG